MKGKTSCHAACTGTTARRVDDKGRLIDGGASLSTGRFSDAGDGNADAIQRGCQQPSLSPTTRCNSSEETPTALFHIKLSLPPNKHLKQTTQQQFTTLQRKQATTTDTPVR
jgi:hypothetical protein